MINIKELKEVKCPRCEGYGFIRGQKTMKRKLPNYKFNDDGLCYACKGKKVLHLYKENILLREEDGRLLKYDNKGEYKGIFKRPMTPIKTIEEIRKFELESLTTLVGVLKKELEISDGLYKIREKGTERYNYYNELKLVSELKPFLETTIDVLNVNKVTAHSIKLNANTDDDIIKFMIKCENHFECEIEFYSNKLRQLYK